MRDLFLDALATYRLVRLVTTDDIFVEPREAILRWAEQDSWTPVVRRKVGTLISCGWCSSVWVGFGVSLARQRFAKLWDPLARALAYSAVAGLIASRED